MPRPPHTATVLGVALVVTGSAMLLLGWRGAAGTFFVPGQVAYALSGGLLGLCTLGTGLGVLSIHLTRVATARRSRALDELGADVAELLALAHDRTDGGSRPLAAGRRTHP